MTIINASPDRPIQLGYEGEDRVTVLRFRYGADWLENGEGIFRIRVRRHGENQAYNAQLVTDDPEYNCLLMTVTDVELSVKGAGEMQVVYSGADFVKKSPIYSYNVSRAVDEAVDPPAQDVYTQIIESLSDLQTDVSEITEDIGQIESSIGALSALTTAKIGDLTELTTEAKSSLVSAINEVNSKSVDDALSATSTNPVQNKVLTKVITVRIASAESAIASAQTAIQGKADIQTVSALADAVNDLDSDVQGLQTIVQEKADTQTVSALADAVQDLDGDVQGLQTSKADMSTVTALSDTVSGLQTAVQSKADTTTVTALSGTVSSLSDATHQYMEQTESTLSDLQDYKADLSYVNDELADKADAQTVTTLSGTVSGLQTSKADKSYVDTQLGTKASTAVATNSYPSVEAETASVVSITDGADGIPVKSLVVGIEPVQAGSGDPSPDNVRPISGWTGAKVTRTGKNLNDTEQLPPTSYSTSYWGVSYNVLVDLINSLPVGTYTLSHKAEILTLPDSGLVQHGPFYVTAMVNGSQVPVSRHGTTTDNSPSVGKVYEDSTTFTITETNKGKCNHVYSYCDSTVHASPGRGKYKIYNIQLELGSTATAYAPYQGETYDITFPSEAGTVYGGSLDVTNGVLTVNRASVDLGTLFWYKIRTTGSHWRFWAYLNDIAYGGEMLSSQYKHITATQSYMGESGIASQTSGSNYLAMVTDERFSDANTFKTSMSGVQLVYELAEPITYTLAPTEIRSLLGQNNLWADTGDVQEMIYRADTKLYVDGVRADHSSMIAPVEEAYTATRNYTTGQLLIVDNTLYKVTANIANGGAITVGANVVATTLSEVISALA